MYDLLLTQFIKCIAIDKTRWPICNEYIKYEKKKVEPSRICDLTMFVIEMVQLKFKCIITVNAYSTHSHTIHLSSCAPLSISEFALEASGLALFRKALR